MTQLHADSQTEDRGFRTLRCFVNVSVHLRQSLCLGPIRRGRCACERSDERGREITRKSQPRTCNTIWARVNPLMFN